MFRISILSAVIAAAAFLTSCSNKMEMAGVPGWIASGAKIGDEPEPYRPDPAIIEHESEGGPIEFKMITDKRQYKAPPAKKKTKPEPDPLERGREWRIKRLVR